MTVASKFWSSLCQRQSTIYIHDHSQCPSSRSKASFVFINLLAFPGTIATGPTSTEWHSTRTNNNQLSWFNYGPTLFRPHRAKFICLKPGFFLLTPPLPPTMPAIRTDSPKSSSSGLDLASATPLTPTPTHSRQKYIRLTGKTLRDQFRKAYEDSADPEASSC
jgi:hypothetical protein